MDTSNDTVRKLFNSVFPSVVGVVVAHPMLTLKINRQVVGGKPKSLYSGMGWYLAKSVPGNSISFMLLQTDYIQSLPPWAQGAVSKFTGEAILYPFSLWATKQQVGLKRSGYLRGLVPTLGRDLVFWSIFTQIHRGWLGDGDQALPYADKIPLPVRLMIAASAATIATQPLDWYKVHAQLGMKMNGLGSGLLWRLAYANVRSVFAWGLFEMLISRS